MPRPDRRRPDAPLAPATRYPPTGQNREIRPIRGDPAPAAGPRRRRRPGRPRRTRIEWQELLYHRYALLVPAARAAHAVIRRGPVEDPDAARPAGTPVPPGAEREAEQHTADWLVRFFHGRPAWLARGGWRTFLRLLYDGPPSHIARVTLARQHHRALSTITGDIKAASTRHRAGLCRLDGPACPILGGLHACPNSLDDPRWRALRDRFRPPPADDAPRGAPPRVRLMYP